MEWRYTMNQTSGYTSDGIGFQKQDTSHKAATQNKKNKLSLRQEVLQYFKENQKDDVKFLKFYVNMTLLQRH